MYVDTNGNIGVNTQTPHQMFHVVDGNILLSHSSTRAPGSYNGSILFGTKNPQAKFDAFGRIVPVETHGRASLPSPTTTVTTSDIPSGVYVLRVTLTDGTVRTTKIVKR